MCGIAGLWQTRDPVRQANIGALSRQMADALTHRGPDGGGVWVDAKNRCALSHRRLSIIDVSNAGAQPFSSRDQRWQLTFNGEIYNFQEIREVLERRGRVFCSRSDTEVLVEAIAEWGSSAVDRFDGMFAFAAFDTQTGELIVARDPFGEKPLYLTTLKTGLLAFASELRALELLPDFDARISMDALSEYLCFQYVGAPRTIYQSVDKLKPGHVTVFSPNQPPRTRRYYEFNPGRPSVRRTLADAADELETILLRSIERRLVADVPLGAFLSGGVDSSLVCALVTQKLRIPLNTYSMGFQDAPESEHLVARAFASHIGARHHESIIAPDVGMFLDVAGRVLDEPNADTSCFPTYLLSEFARRHVTVAVSGDGGDELFGGYGRYSATLLESDLQGLGELPFWRPGDAYYGPRILISSEEDVAALLGGFPAGAHAHLQELRQELDGSQSLLSAMRRSDVENYMPGAVLAKVDRMSMQHSLEVRTPFLNAELARFAETTPDEFCCGRGSSKRILRELAGRYLPKELVCLPKQGFGLPMAEWTRESLLPRAKAMLSGDGVLRAVFKDSLKQAVERHETSNGFDPYRLWSIVVLDAWLRERNVTFPDLPASTHRREESPADRNAYWWAAQCTEKVFVVASGSRHSPPRTHFRDLGASIQFECAKLLQTAPSNEFGEPQVIDIDGHEPPKPSEVFNGATLFFVDKDAAIRIGSAGISRLRAMQISRIVMRHRFDENVVEDLTFQYFKAARKFLNTLNLWRHRSSIYAGEHNFMRWFLGQTLYHQSKHMYYRENDRPFLGPNKSELSDRHAVFYGMTQCPPLRVDFDDVNFRGDGRYWIYDNMIGLSEPASGRIIRRVFWAVPITHKIARNLDIVPTAFYQADNAKQPATLNDLLQSLAARDLVGERAKPLMPGDRIAVVTHALPPGGAERQWVYLASALTQMGFNVTFITLDPLQGENAHYYPYLRKNGIQVIQSCNLPGGGTASGTLADYPAEAEELVPRLTLARFINAIRLAAPRVVFGQLDLTNIISGMAGLICDVERIVLSFRNYNPSYFDYIYKPLYRSAYKILSGSSRVALTGNFVGANDDYADWIGVPRSSVTTIPNALDTDIFATPADEQIKNTRAEFGLSASAKVILGVFRLSAEKRPLLFIETARALAEDRDDVHVILAGVGPLLDSARAAVADSSATNRIHLVGKRDDVNVLMAMASLLLHTASREGMPNVVMEAITSGVPIVATKAGAIPSLVVDGENGFLHDEEDREGLRTSCQSLLDDPVLRARMREASLRRVAADFSPGRMAQQYLNVASPTMP